MVTDYPNAPYPVGTIFTLSEYDHGHAVTMVGGVPFYDVDFIKYPSIFQRLHWWEAREPEDLPKYLKLTNRVSTAARGAVCEAKYTKTGVVVYYDGGGAYISRHYTLPSTLSEYEAYQSSLK